jgi:hypothetical protein
MMTLLTTLTSCGLSINQKSLIFKFRRKILLYISTFIRYSERYLLYFWLYKLCKVSILHIMTYDDDFLALNFRFKISDIANIGYRYWLNWAILVALSTTCCVSMCPCTVMSSKPQPREDNGIIFNF